MKFRILILNINQSRISENLLNDLVFQNLIKESKTQWILNTFNSYSTNSKNSNIDTLNLLLHLCNTFKYQLLIINKNNV